MVSEKVRDTRLRLCNHISARPIQLVPLQVTVPDQFCIRETKPSTCYKKMSTHVLIDPGKLSNCFDASTTFAEWTCRSSQTGNQFISECKTQSAISNTDINALWLQLKTSTQVYKMRLKKRRADPAENRCWSPDNWVISSWSGLKK